MCKIVTQKQAQSGASGAGRVGRVDWFAVGRKFEFAIEFGWILARKSRDFAMILPRFFRKMFQIRIWRKNQRKNPRKNQRENLCKNPREKFVRFPCHNPAFQREFSLSQGN